METVTITLTKWPAGIEEMELGYISCAWDRKSFALDKNINIKLVMRKEGEEKDVTNYFFVKAKVLKGTSIMAENQIVFKDVKLEIQVKNKVIFKETGEKSPYTKENRNMLRR